MTLLGMGDSERSSVSEDQTALNIRSGPIGASRGPESSLEHHQRQVPLPIRCHLEILVLARRESVANQRMGVYHHAMAGNRNRKT